MRCFLLITGNQEDDFTSGNLLNLLSCMISAACCQAASVCLRCTRWLAAPLRCVHVPAQGSAQRCCARVIKNTLSTGPC